MRPKMRGTSNKKDSTSAVPKARRQNSADERLPVKAGSDFSRKRETLPMASFVLCRSRSSSRRSGGASTDSMVAVGRARSVRSAVL
eukprot:6209412-Pleurochrysis_carterae.AAC.2